MENKEKEKISYAHVSIHSNCMDIIKEWGHLEHRTNTKQCEHILEEWAFAHAKDLKAKKEQAEMNLLLGLPNFEGT